MNIELTTEQANELIKLMDAGVRQAGLQSAGIAAVVMGKLQAAAEPQPQLQPQEESNAPA